MKIEEINVPKGIRYLSDWEDFRIPNHPCIIDKQIPGCGFTEYCLTNDQNIILACPRRILLENKYDQHRGEVHLVKNYYLELSVDESIDKLLPNAKKLEEINNLVSGEDVGRDLANKNRGIIEKDLDTYITLRWTSNKPAKILVTYDSFRLVKEYLIRAGLFNKFHVIVDEFQSIFVDSRFKADVEMEFIGALEDINKLCYVSATPMIDEYLDRLDQFKDLPYYRLNWNALDPGRVARPGLTVRVLKSVNTAAKNIIDKYRAGDFEKSARINDKGESEVVESKEAVIYVNSINNIVNIIKKCDLKPEEINILCANTSENQSRIDRELGKGNFMIGKVPLKDEPRKMITLCTRTVYLGADFYSDNARTFVISDANVESLAIDITLDLPQILGRQRLESNPWKNKAEVFIRTIVNNKKLSREKFKKLIDIKLFQTDHLLAVYNKLTDKNEKDAISMKYLKCAVVFRYVDDYVGVNCHKGSYMVPELNVLAMVAEQRAFDIQQVDYADRFSVFNRIVSTFGNGASDEINKEIFEFQSVFNNLPEFRLKLKYLCEADLSDEARIAILDLIPDNFKRFYLTLGPEKCKKFGYNYSPIKKYANDLENLHENGSKLDDIIYESFTEGSRKLRKDIKDQLQEVYESMGLNKKAKAIDIKEWFEIRDIRMLMGDGSKSPGFELVKRLK